MKRLLKVLSILVLIITIFQPVEAGSGKSVIFKNKEDITIDLWKKADNIDYSKSELEKLKLKLDTMSITELGEGKTTVNVINQTSVVSLKYGTYYYRETGDNPRISGVFIVSEDSDNEIYFKHNFVPFNKSIVINKYLDSKDDKNRVEGIKFNLYRKSVDNKNNELVTFTNGRYDPDSKNYELITDRQGKIGLYGLAEGDYILKEISTKEGYKLIDKISINLHDKDSVELHLVNLKNSPNLPETGVGSNNWMIFVSIGALVGIIVLFVIMRRKRGNKDNEEKDI